MKKFTLILILCITSFMLSAQDSLTFSGTVTDTLTGMPVVNHAVIIQSDSSFGFYYYNVVYTNPNGFYSAIVPIAPAMPYCMFTVTTYDCMQNPHYQMWTYTAGGSTSFTRHFVICVSNINCQADYTYVHEGLLAMQFIDQSTSPTTPHLWNFGDGTTSSQMNPLHTFPALGFYNVSLTVGTPGTNCWDEEVKVIWVGDSTSVGCQADFYTEQNPAYASVVHFIDQSVGTIQTWTWNFGDGYSQVVTFPQNPNVMHTYQMPGIYSACLHVQGTDSCFSTKCETIIISDSMPGCQADFYTEPNPSIASGVYFIDQSVGNIQTWTWNFGDGATQIINFPQNPNVMHAYQMPGIYNACLQVLGADSCFSTKCETIIISDSIPGCQADFYTEPNPSIASGVYFIDQSVGNIQTWTWNFGDGATQIINFPNNPDVEHTYQMPGTYSACLYIQGADSCTSLKCETVSIGDTLSGCQAYFAYSIDSLGGSNLVHFQDLSQGNPTHWYWDFGDGTYSSEQNPTHQFLPNVPVNIYHVCLTVTGNNNYCYDTFCKEIVLPGITPCNAQFMVIPAPGSVNSFYFQDQSTGNIQTWTWDFGDGSVQTITTPANPNVEHTYLMPGYYTACLFIEGDDSCRSTFCHLVSAGDTTWNCQAQFAWYPDSSNTTYNTIHFMDLSNGNPNQWHWDFGDGTTSNLQNPVHQFPETGTYDVCLTIHGPSCQSVWCAEVQTGPGNMCMNYYTYSNIGLTVNFEGHLVDSVANADYFWDFGDSQTGAGQNIIHTYNAPGIYYVTLTTTASYQGAMCTASSVQMVSVGDSTSWNQVYGQVFAGTFPLGQGLVMLLSVDTLGTYVPFVDVAEVDSSGIFYFPMVPEGNFVIYAIPFEYGYLPTYYGDVLYWQQATIVVAGAPNNPYIIHLIQGDPSGSGSGSIYGSLQQGDINTSLIDKVTMLLKDDQGNEILFDRVDDAGAFEFPQLAYGTYYLYAEMAGCQSQTIKVVLDEANPNAEVNLVLSGNRVLGSDDNALSMSSATLSPNPAGDYTRLTISSNAEGSVKISLGTMEGRQIYCSTESLHSGDNSFTIQLAGVSPGIYTLRIIGSNGLMLTRKLVIAN